ncbi:site-specific integrase [Mucilaginibacter paludis]|uniref:Integrase family protein n=1 Tax=Mucilaginibacter paludis DSM 18603 TaxID=714943 RepID=H1YAF6_9SPHI|nr:site-specific integrase [Mucilaginibacter paludis]EHQ26999.1 integrase family protein [Mucilaginibacter paludis DSM 18603]
MLESSFGLLYFLKASPNKENVVRYIYARITVDGYSKEFSTKRKWAADRWSQKAERAIGTKEDAKTLNHFLDSFALKVELSRTELMNANKTVTARALKNLALGKSDHRRMILVEFQKHNDEMKKLIGIDFAEGTYERYVTAMSHVKSFIITKYERDDLEVRELNYEFVKDYEVWLKTVRNCSHNTTLKYIGNFKKIVLLCVAKQYILTDPFKLFKAKKKKIKKRPLTPDQLFKLENYKFSTERLSIVRDVFVFQCYTGLAYTDAYQLKAAQIGKGIDGEQWIMSDRQKTKSETNIPLLPGAIRILKKYKNHPICIKRGTVIPVKSNQKMNEYLKEIADLCEITFALTTHRARRTFASTVTLGNDVPIDTVKEMLGHQTVQQTEGYALTSQEKVSRNMRELKEKLQIDLKRPSETPADPATRRPVFLEEISRNLPELRGKASQPSFSPHPSSLPENCTKPIKVDPRNLFQRFADRL